MKTMRRIWNSFKIAFAMYSKIPMPRADWEKENMRYMMCFFPFVGIVIGALMVGWSFLSGKLGVGDSLRSVIYVLIPVLVTGGIHLDGLLDTADALSSWQSREKKLEILKDSNAGAFAVIVACCYFLACFGFWTELSGRQVLVLSGGYVLSRSMSGLSVASFPCARKTGTVSSLFRRGAGAHGHDLPLHSAFSVRGLHVPAGREAWHDGCGGSLVYVFLVLLYVHETVRRYHRRPGGLLRADLRAGHGHLRVGGGEILISAVWKKRSLRKQQENIGGNQT